MRWCVNVGFVLALLVCGCGGPKQAAELSAEDQAGQDVQSESGDEASSTQGDAGILDLFNRLVDTSRPVGANVSFK